MLRNFMREVSQVVSKLIWEIKTKLLPKLSILTELVYAQFSWALRHYYQHRMRSFLLLLPNAIGWIGSKNVRLIKIKAVRSSDTFPMLEVFDHFCTAIPSSSDDCPDVWRCLWRQEFIFCPCFTLSFARQPNSQDHVIGSSNHLSKVPALFQPVSKKNLSDGSS